MQFPALERLSDFLPEHLPQTIAQAAAAVFPTECPARARELAAAYIKGRFHIVLCNTPYDDPLVQAWDAGTFNPTHTLVDLTRTRSILDDMHYLQEIGLV